MRLTTMTDYAMRLLMYVAQRPHRLCTIAEVAAAYGISEAHLMKVTHQLGMHGWIETIRGKGGGIRLAGTPADINLGAVVRGIESDFQLVECFAVGSSDCTLTGDCRLTGLLHEALQRFLQHLDGHTLADLLAPTALPSAARATAVPVLRGAGVTGVAASSGPNRSTTRTIRVVPRAAGRRSRPRKV